MSTPIEYKVNNPSLNPLVSRTYRSQDLATVQQYFTAHKTLKFTPTPSGLFPAAATADAANTGYKYVWVRDNIYVAYAHYIMGEYSTAANTLNRLMAYFQKFSFRLADIIKTPERKEQVMQRPNIRFDGETLTEVDENWEHAQNDALGYFVWLYCTLSADPKTQQLIPLDDDAIKMLSQFVQYFEAIRYWEDPDSGHWEEGRKLSASSIGPVIAGLNALQKMILAKHLSLDPLPTADASAALISRLLQQGQTALDAILPWECRTPGNERRYDAALLYLIYPLNVVSKSQAQAILADVQAELTGPYGVARYPYDSFWCRDFQDLDKSIQTAQYLGRETWLKKHNRAVKRGEEAQWCIFDPIISAIYGEWFQANGDAQYLDRQTRHFNRALGQITGEGNTVDTGQGNHKPVTIPAHRCPELYYLQHNEYRPNVSTPLLWTQANLCIAFKLMERSIARG